MKHNNWKCNYRFPNYYGIKHNKMGNNDKNKIHMKMKSGLPVQKQSWDLFPRVAAIKSSALLAKYPWKSFYLGQLTVLRVLVQGVRT